MRTSKRVVALVLALAFLVLLNAGLTFALEPYGSKSELAWTDYAKQDRIDTVIVGTSLVQNAIDPNQLDELTGCTSFCLATPNQKLEESFVAIQKAHEDYGITRAILGVSSIDFQEEDPPNLGDAFMYHRSLVASPQQNLSAAWQILVNYGGIKNSDSINALFPWYAAHVTMNLSSILENIQLRLTKDLYEAADIADSVGHYEGKGHMGYDFVLDYDVDSAPYFSSREDGLTDTHVDADRAHTLADLYAYCDEHGIELVAITVPMPVYNVVDGDGYYELRDNMNQVFEDLGRSYYDFNFAKPELFQTQPDYFMDTVHMNSDGARDFTESFARFLGMLEGGGDVDGLFCSDDEQRSSVDYISAVFADSTIDGSGVHIAARAVAGSQVKAEYQLCVLDEAAQTWNVVRDWGEESSFDYVPEQQGLVAFRVNAREVGSAAEYDRYRDVLVLY